MMNVIGMVFLVIKWVKLNCLCVIVFFLIVVKLILINSDNRLFMIFKII